MTSSFVYDWGSPEARFTEWPETQKLLQEIHNQVVRDNRQYIYQHKVMVMHKCMHLLLSDFDSGHREISSFLII